MATGKKTGGRDFKKGQPGGPGRPPIPQEVKALAKVSYAQFLAMVGNLGASNIEQVKERQADPATTMLELCVLKILENALTEGDPKYLTFITDRLYGRVKEQVEISVPKPTYIDNLDGTMLKLGTTLDADLVESPKED
jgi:hypothetical protein